MREQVIQKIHDGLQTVFFFLPTRLHRFIQRKLLRMDRVPLRRLHQQIPRNQIKRHAGDNRRERRIVLMLMDAHHVLIQRRNPFKPERLLFTQLPRLPVAAAIDTSCSAPPLRSNAAVRTLRSPTEPLLGSDRSLSAVATASYAANPAQKAAAARWQCTGESKRSPRSPAWRRGTTSSPLGWVRP